MLLWNGVWPSTHEHDRVRAALAEARAEAFAMLPSLGGALETPDGMEGCGQRSVTSGVRIPQAIACG